MDPKTMKKHVETQLEWETRMAEKIWQLLIGELYLDFPYMSLSLNALKPVQKEGRRTPGTDGTYLYYEAGQLISLFQKNSRYLNRMYLHTVLHCIYSHLWIGGDRDRDLWGLACDIAVEYTIDTMEKPSVVRPLTWLRQKTYETLQKQNGISGAVIYDWLMEQGEEEWNKLQREFFTDDHTLWPKEEENRARTPSPARKRWDQIARQEQILQKKQGREPDEGEKILAAQVTAQRNHRNYREFLKKFAVRREELHADPDTFDVNYYTYGLRLYGNLPLLEPVETREVDKIQEFVIVLDTSYSTNGDLVRRFLQETFTILTDSHSFHRGSRIWVIQCDEQVQQVKLVQNEREVESWMKQFTILGGGGTDFRPAFRLVNQMIERKEIRNLSGLLYFTDGKGTYPGKPPAYKTAFLFLDEYEEETVPAWAIRMRLTPDSLGGKR
jgi:predicted metal-dependent peptidase